MTPGSYESPQRAVAGWRTLLAVSLLTQLAASQALAEADGPDFFGVTGVATQDVLNMRAGPSARAEKVGEIPPDGQCVRNLGCRGGLTFQEYSTLSAAQRNARLKAHPRWCKVEYQGITGWVAGRYLMEGTCNEQP